MAMNGTILLQLLQSLLPDGTMRIPNEVDGFQLSDAFQRHRRWLVLLQQLVLVTLSLAPARQRFLGAFLAVRDLRVPVGVHVGAEFLELLVPLIFLVSTESRRVRLVACLEEVRLLSLLCSVLLLGGWTGGRGRSNGSRRSTRCCRSRRRVRHGWQHVVDMHRCGGGGCMRRRWTHTSTLALGGGCSGPGGVSRCVGDHGGGIVRSGTLQRAAAVRGGG
mmetsp:Transcript_3397/g.9665  ORF Transcript_3397/g.9665 Transcript_3397/m.9665 type:complete len:219 (+) Transcript_3397:422-1078(+)